MNGEVAQLITLVSYGNAFLQKGEEPKDFLKNESFKFTNAVNFVDLSGGKEQKLADNSLMWFDYLKRSGCVGLRLDYLPSDDEDDKPPDYMMAGFVGGGGDWHISAKMATGEDLWQGSWEVTRENDPQDNIWTVTYGRLARNGESINPNFPQIKKCRSLLANALKDISSFASKQRQEVWLPDFQTALKNLDADFSKTDTALSYLIPQQLYTSEAKQLLSAATAAWVFGGMGWWNDQGYNDAKLQEEFDAVTEELYSVVILSILAAVNLGQNR